MARDFQTELFSILAEERQALLNAHYGSLPAIAAAKDQCLQALGQSLPPRAVLLAFKTQIEENQQLIKAELRGVDAARKRIAALEDVRDVLTTYDPSGKVSLMPNTQTTIEKKA